MADNSTFVVGGFRVPTEFEDENSGRRLYTGAGDPNMHMLSANPFFIPPPRPGDRYLQIDVVPMIEWVFTLDGIWVELSTRYDRTPPDYTKILDIIEAEI